MHAHIWRGRETDDVQKMRRSAEMYGVKKILVSALSGYYPDEDEITSLNETTAKLIAEDSLFEGYVYVSPEKTNSLDVLKKGIETQGMCGMKIWVSCFCNDPRCDRLYDYCGQNKIPVLIHALAKAKDQIPTESTAVQVRDAALRHPDTKFIMAHLCGNCYYGLPLIQNLPNVWTDISGSFCRGDDLPYAIETLGSDRILFGTDMPGSFVMSYGRVLDAAMTQQDRENILWKNTVSLFGF